MSTAHYDADLTDIGNARILANFFRGRLAWVPELGIWRRWTGRRWVDDNDEAMRDAKVVAKSWFDDIAEEADERRQKRLLAHAQRSSQLPRLLAMIELAKIDLTIPLRQWDAHLSVLGTRSGAVDLSTGQLLAPDPQLRIAKGVACEFDPGAAAPTWSAFLDRVMDGDLAMISFLQRAVGYSLTGDTSEQCIFILHGRGANGKSVFLRALRDLFDEYGEACAAETLLASRDSGIGNDIARLANARFVCAVETEDGKRLAEAMTKAITGGDRITARFLYQEIFEFTPMFKLWLGTNHKPAIRGDDHAIWRRIRLLPFNVTIPDAEQDRGLLAKLAAERPGILNWAITGCLAWQRHGLIAPEPVVTATAAYRADSDHLGMWLEERCVVGATLRMQASQAFHDYQRWSEDRGERAMTLTAFGNRLTERGISKVKGRLVMYEGVGLCDTCDSLRDFSGNSSSYARA